MSLRNRCELSSPNKMCVLRLRCCFIGCFARCDYLAFLHYLDAGVAILLTAVKSEHNTSTLTGMAMDPCGDAKKGSVYTMDDVVRKADFFVYILKALQLPHLFKEREGIDTIYGNEEDCELLKMPTQLRKSSGRKKTLLNLYGDLTIYASALEEIEERELCWIMDGRILPREALDGVMRHYVEANVYDIMCALYTVIQRPNKIQRLAMKNQMDLTFDTEPVCSVFRTVHVLERFQSYTESAATLLKQIGPGKKSRKEKRNRM